MPTPKATTKILYQKGECKIEYEDNLDASQYYLFELTRAALRDVGKFVSKKFRELYASTFKHHTQNAEKSIKYNVWSSKNTKYPKVEVGIKGGKGFYSLFEECGSSKTPRYGLLRRAVEDNIEEIIKIESQYLSGIEYEPSQIEAMINEGEMSGGISGEE